MTALDSISGSAVASDSDSTVQVSDGGSRIEAISAVKQTAIRTSRWNQLDPRIWAYSSPDSMILSTIVSSLIF